MAFCQACGVQVQPDARFCTVCGQPVNISVSSVPSASAATANAATPLSFYSPPVLSNAGIPQTSSGGTPGAQVSKKAIQSCRPKGVTVLAVVAFLGAVLTVPIGLFLLYYLANISSVSETPMAQFLIWLFPKFGKAKGEMISELGLGAVEEFLIAAICTIASYGLWMRREWGRIFAIVSIVLAILHAATMIFTGYGTLLWHLFAIGVEVWSISYLLKPSVKQAFSNAG